VVLYIINFLINNQPLHHNHCHQLETIVAFLVIVVIIIIIIISIIAKEDINYIILIVIVIIFLIKIRADLINPNLNVIIALFFLQFFFLRILLNHNDSFLIYHFILSSCFFLLFIYFISFNNLDIYFNKIFFLYSIFY